MKAIEIQEPVAMLYGGRALRPQEPLMAQVELSDFSGRYLAQWADLQPGWQIQGWGDTEERALDDLYAQTLLAWLEFVLDPDPATLSVEAKALKQWLLDHFEEVHDARHS